MEKLHKRFQERASSLLRLLLSSVQDAVVCSSDQLERIIPACLKERQRSRMSPLEILEAESDPLLELDQPTIMKNAG